MKKRIRMISNFGNIVLSDWYEGYLLDGLFDIIANQFKRTISFTVNGIDTLFMLDNIFSICIEEQNDKAKL